MQNTYRGSDAYVALIARSGLGVGLFHATLDKKKSLNGWLRKIKEILGAEIIFSIIYFCDLPPDYERSFKSRCNSFGIKANVGLQKGANSLLSGPIGIDNGPKLMVGEAAVRKKVETKQASSAGVAPPGASIGGIGFEKVDYYSAVVGNKTSSEVLVGLLEELVQETIEELEEKIKNGYFYEDKEGRQTSIGELCALRLMLKGEDEGAAGPLSQQPLGFIKAKIRQHCADSLTRQSTASIAGLLHKVYMLFDYFLEPVEESTTTLGAEGGCGDDWVTLSDEESDGDDEWSLVEGSDCDLGAGAGNHSSTLFQQQYSEDPQRDDKSASHDFY
ncbi:hypothetical protein A0O36_01283 [Piscirickettsiaceae bacterium NZ-RLO1]|nr:hypothetical protein A0O36_01283 [Piscirickettsiaceae bacterium NZ-RLO1]